MEQADKCLNKNPEQILDEDQAFNIMTDRKKYQDYAEKMLGRDLLEKITLFAESNHIFELDILKLTGCMSIEEADEYRRLLPEYIETEKAMNGLAMEICTRLGDKLPGYVDQSLSNKNISSNTKLVRFFTDLERVILTQQISPYSTFRNGYLRNLFDQVAGMLSAGIFHQVLESDKYSDKQQKMLASIYYLLGKIYGAKKLRFAGTELLKQCMQADQCLSQNLEHFDQLLENNRYKDMPLEKLKEESTGKFKKIREMMVFRRIHSFYKVEGNTMVEFNRELCDKLRLTKTVAAGSLVFNPVVDPKMASIERGGAKDGISPFPRVLNLNSVNFVIGDGDGDICFTNTQVPMIVTGDEKEYQVMKNIILDALLDHLESKEDDVEGAEMTKKPEKPVTPSIMDEIRNELNQALLDQVDDVAIEIGAEVAMTMEELLGNQMPEQEEVQPVSDRDLKDAGEQLAEREYYHLNLRGLKPKLVKKALISLLGPPTRITGSHHFFRCRGQNGGTRVYPISFHERDSDVGLGLLKKCLGEYGITPAELVAQL